MKKKIVLIIIVMTLLCCKDDKKQKELIISKKNTEVNKNNEPLSKFSVIGWRSNIVWRANRILDSHSGKITVNSGNMEMLGDQISSGVFNLDMNSLIVTNLKGKEKEELELLLKGQIKGKENIFFNTNEYPNATFEIVDSYFLNDSRYLSGDLTLNGITQIVEDFAVNFENFEGDDSKIWLTSKNFEINRLDWNINYGSKTIEEDLVDEFIIRDKIKIRIKILFNRL